MSLMFPKPVREKRERKPLRRTGFVTIPGMKPLPKWLKRRKGLRPRTKRKGLDRVGADKPETLRQGFRDPGSYVHIDGRWVLFGTDWNDQRLALYMRAKGLCEKCHRPLDLGTFHPHHRIHRSAGRDDRLENLEALCGKACHDLEHPEKNRLHWSRK